MSSNEVQSWRERISSNQVSVPTSSQPTNAVIEFVRDDSLPQITRRSRTLKRSETIKRYLIRHNLASCTSPLDVEIDVDNFYRKFLDESLSDANQSDIYSVYINSDTLAEPIFLHNSRVSNRDDQAFLNALYEISQSNSTFLTHGELVMQINIVKCVQGAGRIRKAPYSFDDQRKKKTQSLVLIDYSVGHCFLRALALCIYHKEKYPSDVRRKWSAMKSDVNKQFELVQVLIDRYGLAKKEIIDHDDLETIQKLIPDYRIIVIDRYNWRNIIFKGDSTGETLFIEFDSCDSPVGHYNAIISMTGYTGLSYFCEKCHIGSKERLRHRCKGSCKYCRSPVECQKETIRTKCSDCNVIFPNNNCYLKHKEVRICGHIRRCDKCDGEWVTRYQHECNANRCKKCNLVVLKNHVCYMKPLDLRKLSEEDENFRVTVFFDIESCQRNQTLVDGDDLVHSAMLLISKTFCDECLSPDNGEKSHDPCEFCGSGVQKFWGSNCVEVFGDYLYHNIAPKVEKNGGSVIVLAHNGKGYDFHFILRDLFKRSFITTDIMMNGNKIMHMRVGNITFVDSLLFFAQSLASLPKAFGVSHKVIKGFFPHHFNTPTNWTYRGPLPDRKFFQPEMMKPEIYSQFESWYDEMIKSNMIFDFKEEIIKYCLNDVEILATCCLTFRAKFLSLNGIDPFTRCFTIAQVGLELLRGLYLPQDTLAVTPKKGYTNLSNCSFEGLAWIDWQKKLLKTEILREYKIGHFFADGFSSDLNTIFEYFGCFYHGCPKCFPNDRDKQQTLYGDSLNSRYLKTLEKIEYYKSRNFKVVSSWACELKVQKSRSIEFKEYFNVRKKYWFKLQEYGPANVKESFFGGRTNNIKFYHKCCTNEEIKYMDVNSLYPFVLKCKNYPVGHPKVINENFDYSLESYFGFVKCQVLPPKDLYLPVLPMRIGGKLLFPLCRTCVESEQERCDHNPKQRALIGTWTTAELMVALQEGYRILDMFEVLHYSEKSATIFSGYIDKFLKIKHEASGWPSWCGDEESKQFFLKQVKDREGIELDSEKIEKNPALRFIAKLLLNSLWGKLAQNPEKKKVELIHDYDSLWRKLTDDKIEIKSEIMVNDKALILQYKNKEESLEYGPNTSLAVASFVTSYARLELYQKMRAIENIRPGSLMYYDTDSLIYYRKKSDPEIECGDHLGQLKDEILSDYGLDAFIDEFITCGPKNYAFKVQLPEGIHKTVVKSKGITLNSATLQVIDYEFMLSAAKRYGEGKTSDNQSIKVPQFNIVIDSHHNVLTKYFLKAYRVVSRKRIVINNNTFPYGYLGDKALYISED